MGRRYETKKNITWAVFLLQDIFLKKKKKKRVVIRPQQEQNMPPTKRKTRDCEENASFTSLEDLITVAPSRLFIPLEEYEELIEYFAPNKTQLTPRQVGLISQQRKRIKSRIHTKAWRDRHKEEFQALKRTVKQTQQTLTETRKELRLLKEHNASLTIQLNYFKDVFAMVCGGNAESEYCSLFTEPFVDGEEEGSSSYEPSLYLLPD